MTLLQRTPNDGCVTSINKFAATCRIPIAAAGTKGDAVTLISEEVHVLGQRLLARSGVQTPARNAQDSLPLPPVVVAPKKVL